MKKIYLSVLALLLACGSYATNYFVDFVNGSDALGTGLSSGSAYKTIQKAANLTLPGDTVFIMNGTYTTTGGTVININRSGDATGQIVYTNFPGHSPKLQAGAQTYAVISLSAGTSYITVNGLEISGHGVNLSLAADTAAAKAQLVCPTNGSPATSQTPLQKYNGHGFTADSRSATVGSHHIVISNNNVHDNCAAGISFLKCDYVTVSGNTTYNNSWYTIYGTSGITLNQSYNYDNNSATYRNIVVNNKSYGNRMYVPFYNDCKVTDGNGIIMDVPQPDYFGRSLVANNICFNNGGSGIHSFSMNHTDIIHNVSYLNSASPEINSANIYALQTDDVKIMNNIIVARPGKRMNALNSSTNLVYDYNIFYGGTTYELVGAHSIIQDPKFVNASTDPAVADFHLLEGSLGVNAGNNAFSYPTDYAGTLRPSAGTVDIGAYESSFSGSASCGAATSSLVISSGTGNGTGEASAGYLYAIADTRPSLSNPKTRKAIMYPASLLTSIPANTSITSLKFRRAVQTSTSNATPSTQVLPNNAGFRIYLRNEPADNFGAGALDWNTVIPGAANPATLAYGGDATSIVGNAGGWKEIPLQVPFTYTGGSLGVFVEYIQNGNLAGATDINWIYDNGGSQPLYNITNYPNQANGFKFSSVSGNTAVGTSLATSNERRPVVTIGYCSNGIVPVSWLSFNAVSKNNQVLVSWSTATEANNAGFEVQRSANGVRFETLGLVASKAINGSSASVQAYQFNDDKPLTGKSYYRLAQKDFNGKIVYSSIVAVNLNGKLGNSLSIYPNPVSDVVNALISTPASNQAANVSVKDATGRTVSSYRKVLVAGFNSVGMKVATIPQGVYLLVVELPGGEKMIERFVKQ